MSAAIRGKQRASLNLVPAECPRGGGTPPVLTVVPGSPGWWYAVPADDQGGCVWNRIGDQKSRILSWCPEVLAKLAMLDAKSICQQQYYVVRVDEQLALIHDGDLRQGKGWEQFRHIDLWQALSLKELLADIIYDQAQRLPQIVCREESQ
ncbi:hypothetical protein AB0N62_39385 [Streptomyces sp. NPDC093982]|uniref:hypothetical protein n=1 Tax=Streptomyces sp. NPDC093982 TaxID=3155077 RepID=UPI003412C2A1